MGDLFTFVIYQFHLSFVLLFDPLFFLFWLALDFVMPQHLFCFPYSTTHNLHHSILHPPSLHHSVNLIPILCPLSPSHHFFPYLCLPTPCLSVPFYFYLPNIHSLLLASPFQLCLPYILSLVTLWVIFYILHTTLSLVVYKSFWLVVYPLVCNCCPLLFTQSHPSLPLVSYQSPPWQYNPLVSPLLDSSKIKDNPVPWKGRNT